MIVFPNAKINIGLNIVHKRVDGFHNLETVFYPIMIKDVLEIVEARELSFTSSGLQIPDESDNNICLKAYRLLSRDLKLPPVHIHLHKNIPIGAGIGGGSSDASFVLKLMTEKFKLNISQRQLENYASLLGADCAFFVRNKPVYAFEKGNRFEELELDLSKYFIVLVMPEIHVSTSNAFKNIIPKTSKINLKEVIEGDVNSWKGKITNDFESGIVKRHPQIGRIKDSLYSSGAIYASMSGSGASVYGIFDSPVKLPELELGNRVFYGI